VSSLPAAIDGLRGVAKFTSHLGLFSAITEGAGSRHILVRQVVPS
jgi:hypothetical protein